MQCIKNYYEVEGYWEPSETYNMDFSAEIVNDVQKLSIFAKTYILDVWLGFKCAFEQSSWGIRHIFLGLKRRVESLNLTFVSIVI